MCAFNMTHNSCLKITLLDGCPTYTIQDPCPSELLRVISLKHIGLSDIKYMFKNGITWESPETNKNSSSSGSRDGSWKLSF